jgi:hypothetical protein
MRCITPRLQRALVPLDGRLSNHATTQPCNGEAVQPCNLRHTFLSLVSFFLPYNIALQLAHRAGLHALSMLLSAAQATAVPCRVLTRSPRVCMLHDTERTARGAARHAPHARPSGGSAAQLVRMMLLAEVFAAFRKWEQDPKVPFERPLCVLTPHPPGMLRCGRWRSIVSASFW